MMRRTRACCLVRSAIHAQVSGTPSASSGGTDSTTEICRPEKPSPCRYGGKYGALTPITIIEKK